MRCLTDDHLRPRLGRDYGAQSSCGHINTQYFWARFKLVVSYNVVNTSNANALLFTTRIESVVRLLFARRFSFMRCKANSLGAPRSSDYQNRKLLRAAAALIGSLHETAVDRANNLRKPSDKRGNEAEPPLPSAPG